MPGEVCKRKHFISQRRHKQQVNSRKDARHLFRHFSPEAVRLHQVHGGQEAGLAEEIRPRIRHLNLQLIQFPAECEFLERSCAFGEENQIKRVIRPVRKRDLNRNHAQPFDDVQCGTVNAGCRVFLHPCGEISDAQPFHSSTRVEVKFARHAVHITGVRPGNSMQHQYCVFDVSGHGAEFVKRPTERHRTGAMTLCWSLDKLGPMARNVEDTILVLHAISGPDAGDVNSVPSKLNFDSGAAVEGLRVGYFPAWMKENPATSVDRAALDVVKRLGMVPVEVTLPDWPYDSLDLILFAEG